MWKLFVAGGLCSGMDCRVTYNLRIYDAMSNLADSNSLRLQTTKNRDIFRSIATSSQGYWQGVSRIVKSYPPN